MRIFRLSHVSLPITLLAVALFAGCNPLTVRPANFISPSLNVQEIGCIHVMPLLDGRVDKEQKMNWKLLARDAHNSATSELKRRGYSVAMITEESLIEGLSKEDLTSPNNDRLRGIQVAEARWLLFFVLDDAFVKIGFGSTAGAEMSMFLYDRGKGEVVLRHKGVGQAGSGGLGGMMMANAWLGQAIYKARAECMSAIPIRTKQ